MVGQGVYAEVIESAPETVTLMYPDGEEHVVSKVEIAAEHFIPQMVGKIIRGDGSAMYWQDVAVTTHNKNGLRWFTRAGIYG